MALALGSGRIMGWLQKEIGAQHRRAIGSFEGGIYGAVTAFNIGGGLKSARKKQLLQTILKLPLPLSPPEQ